MANDYTPQQIEEILQMFFDVAGTRQYIGARYVPIFGRGRGTSVEWDNSDAYEPLSIVYYQGDTYTSRRYVPAGIAIDNEDYWVITGRYNAQVEQYRQEVLAFDRRITDNSEAIAHEAEERELADNLLRDELSGDFVPYPDGTTHPKYGDAGQVLSTLGDGATKWEDPVVVDATIAEPIINAWLDDHPEATTTIEDNAVTTAKIANGAVTDAKLAQTGGVLSRVAHLTEDVYDLMPFQFHEKMRSITDDWTLFTGAISATTFWGMNKVYPAGFVKYVVQKIAIGGSTATMILYSVDGQMRQIKNITHGTASEGFVIYEVNEYIPESFYVFALGRTALYVAEDPIYKSKTYDQSTFASNTQFALGVVYDDAMEVLHVPSIDGMSFIKNVSILNDSYKFYALSYVWKGTHGYRYYFRLEGSNDGTTWANVSNLESSGAEPLTGVETISNGTFSVTVNWNETPTTIDSSARKPIKNFNRPYYIAKTYADGAIASDNSVFVTRVAELDYIRDVQVYDTNYRYYALSYVWRNSGGYYYYFRLEGSNDGTNWTNVDNLTSQIAPVTEPVIETISNGTFAVVAEWSSAPATVYNNTMKRLKPIHYADAEKTLIQNMLPVGGYVVKDETRHVITLDTLGNGDYTTVAAAFDYVRSQNPSMDNQFEIAVKPGRYPSLNNIVPPYTHMYGIWPNTVIITSEDYAGQTTQPPLRQDFGSSKLSNLHIISDTGYCIHYDEGLNKCTIVNENLILEHKSENNQSIIGGGSFHYGTNFIWRNCTFIRGNVPCHTNRIGSMNTRVSFEHCHFVDSYLRCGSVGGFGNLVFEVRDCTFRATGTTYGGKYALIAWQDDWATYTDPTLYPANTEEWIVCGTGNRNFLPILESNGTGLMVEANSVNEALEISGSAVPVLFGVPRMRSGNARIKATAKGIYRVQDVQAGTRGSTPIDVFQMWKRLGDCSTTPLTLVVKVNNVSQTYTFNQDYETAQTPMTDILAAVNAVITNATVKAYTPTCWDNVRTDEKTYVIAADNDGILEGEYVRVDGSLCEAEDPSAVVYGRALESGIQGEIVQVWTGNKFAVDLTAGQYGIGSDHKLSSTATEKIGTVDSNGVFLRS